MLNIYRKLKHVREEENLTQGQLAEYMSFKNHTIIQKYETGKMKNIPREYFQFLIDKEYDLNTLFDEGEIWMKKKGNVLNDPQATYNKPCSRCEEKDKEIEKLKNQIEVLQDTIIQQHNGKQRSA